MCEVRGVGDVWRTECGGERWGMQVTSWVEADVQDVGCWCSVLVMSDDRGDNVDECVGLS